MGCLICPVCARPLADNGKTLVCVGNHSFDKSKEGYVNLLTGSRSGDKIGDNATMARMRRDFLNKGYYDKLSDAVTDSVCSLASSGCVTDICCGEGYYTARLAESFPGMTLGFDISKEMVRLAAKRRSKAFFFVANMAHIPLESESQSACVHMFAPFNTQEFSRIIKPGGYLVSAVPGKYHLIGLKQAVYDEPYLNGETVRDTDGFDIYDKRSVLYDITLESSADINALFMMTPYGWKTSEKDAKKLNALTSLTTRLDFDLIIYKRK